ncbi:MAG: hypothetical protein IAF58_12475 [Leptolyngbya sp.]|nr:hypothetical protein [Candidatus Melainabacteria bacterium]
MQCLQCKGKVESDWAFCPNCGKAQEQAWDGPSNIVQFEAKVNQFDTSSYTSGVRAQVFEVIVRQAMAGAPWRAICEGPLLVNKIHPDEIQAEVERRKANLKNKNAHMDTPLKTQLPNVPRPKVVSNSPKPYISATPIQHMSASQRIAKLRTDMISLSVKLCEQEDLYTDCSEIILSIDKLYREISTFELKGQGSESEQILFEDLQRELERVKRIIDADGKEGPHHIKS